MSKVVKAENLSGVPSLTGIKLGKAGLDWLFNTNNTSTKRIELTILYIINADFLVTYQQLRDAYVADKTERNAVVFNDAFLNYVRYQAYASNITEEYIAQALLEGAANQIYNLFSNNNIQTYNDLKGMLDGDINISNGWYNLVGKYYGLYNNILAENERLKWYFDNFVHVTGVQFEHDEVEIGLEDNPFFFWEM